MAALSCCLLCLLPLSVPSELLYCRSLLIIIGESSNLWCFLCLNYNSVIKISGNRPVIQGQSQSITLYWFRIMQCFQISVPLQTGCFLFVEGWPPYKVCCSCIFMSFLNTPTSPSDLLRFHFVCGHHYFHPISCVHGIPLFQVWKKESWVSGGTLYQRNDRHFALNINRCSLMFVAGQPITPRLSVVATHLMFNKAPWVQTVS